MAGGVEVSEGTGSGAQDAAGASGEDKLPHNHTQEVGSKLQRLLLN